MLAARVRAAVSLFSQLQIIMAGAVMLSQQLVTTAIILLTHTHAHGSLLCPAANHSPPSANHKRPSFSDKDA
jgi:hypothetical protein